MAVELDPVGQAPRSRDLLDLRRVVTFADDVERQAVDRADDVEQPLEPLIRFDSAEEDHRRLLRFCCRPKEFVIDSGVHDVDIRMSQTVCRGNFLPRCLGDD